MRPFPRPLFLLLVIALMGALLARPAAAAIVWNKVYSGFPSPVEITQAHDGSPRLFVVQQSGTIRIIKNGVVLPAPFIDLGGASGVTLANGEQGLLGIAFHPQYATNRQFYVNYTRKTDGATVIARYTATVGNPDVADPLSATVLLTIAQPEGNHNGGAVKFGPDGFLYIGMGDGGGANDQHGTIGNGQDKTMLLGKVLRIDVDNGGANPYAIPPGNPYASGVGGRREIFAIGVRNPWRMSFDRLTGDFWFGDVGQDAVEEVDMLPVGTGSGANLGWRVMEGNVCTGLASPAVPCNDPSLTAPVIAYTHTFGCSVTGGYVYRGTAVPALTGQYLYGDFCTGRIWAAQRIGMGPWVPTELGVTGLAISTFGEDEAGELYFADYGTGDIYKFADSGSTTPVLATSATSLTFGSVTIGSSSATQTFNVTNTGGGTLTVTTLTPGGLNPGDFTRTGTCANGTVLTASQSCTVTYQFTPAQIGARAASLAIATNAGDANITLTGTGAAVSLPVLAVSVTALSFGNIDVGSSSAVQTFTVTNSGTGTLTLSTLTAGGVNPGDFVRTGSCANGLSLTAAQSCNVTYKFTPTVAGARAASLAVATNAGNATVTLDGTGTTPTTTPGISVAPVVVDFGSALIGSTSAPRAITVLNIGTSTLTFTAVTLQGSNPGDFLLTGNCAPGFVLAAGATCTLDIKFHPLVAGARAASLALAYGVGTPASVTLTGTGSTSAIDVVDVIEFYHAVFDHYFISSLASDIDALDSGKFKGWTRTTKSFKAWSSPQVGTSPVCRFYIPPAQGDSHFFSASPIECGEVLVKFPTFTYESAAVMQESLPDVVSGTCSPNTVPIYRVWNRRVDSNHRYTTDRALRDTMVAQGYVAEGYGPDSVVMCGPQ